MDSGHQLRQELLDKLASGVWGAGYRLPTERELSERYQLSRTTVRRVLSQLKERGLITQTVGSGTYVSDQAQVRVPEDIAAARLTSPAELMEARLMLEPAMMDMVVRNATTADFERMEDCCAKAEAAGSLPEFEHWDGQLHEAIADAAHNNFVNSISRLMSEARSLDTWGRLKRRSLTQERRLAYQEEHRRLVEALKDRDAPLARERALTHLRHVRDNLLGDG